MISLGKSCCHWIAMKTICDLSPCDISHLTFYRHKTSMLNVCSPIIRLQIGCEKCSGGKKNKFIFHDKFLCHHEYCKCTSFTTSCYLCRISYKHGKSPAISSRRDLCVINATTHGVRIKIYNMDIFWICNEKKKTFDGENCRSMQRRIFINHLHNINHHGEQKDAKIYYHHIWDYVSLSSCNLHLDFFLYIYTHQIVMQLMPLQFFNWNLSKHQKNEYWWSSS